MTVDSSNSIYAVGFAEDGLAGIPSLGGWDFFFAKFDSSGTHEWVELMGTETSYEELLGIDVDGDDNVYAVGYTKGDFDIFTNNGGADVLLIRYGE